MIAAVCVFNEQTAASPAEIVAEAKEVDISQLRGTALLAAEAKQKDAEANMLKAGHDMSSVDSMLHKFQTNADTSWAASLSEAAIKSDPWAIPEPNKDGTIPRSAASAPDSSMDFGGDDDILLQQQDEMEYVPKGQMGIGNAIKQAHADADAREDAKDGLSADEDILGVDADEDDAPLPTMMDDLPEMMLFQAPPTAVKKASEQNQDTSVVVHKLPMAKTFATETFDEGNKYDDEHYKPDNNEFQGDGILSAVGIKDASSSEADMLGTIDADELDFEFHPEDDKN